MNPDLLKIILALISNPDQLKELIDLVTRIVNLIEAAQKK